MDYDNHQWQTTKLVPVQLGGRFGLTGANNTDLIITELQLDDARTYVCTANNKVTIKAEIRAHLFVYSTLYVHVEYTCISIKCHHTVIVIILVLLSV